VLRLLRYLRRYWLRYAGGGLCLLGTASLAMAVPYLLKRAIDAIQQGQPLSRVSTFAAVIVAIAAVQGVVRTLSRVLIFNVGRDVEYDLRNDLFAHLVRLPTAYYQSQHTGDLMSRLINDVTAVRMLLGPGFLNLLNTPIYFVYAIGIMLTLDPGLTVISLLPFPVLLLVVKRVTRRLMEQTLRVQEGLADMSTMVQEKVSGIHVVKAYVAEEPSVAAFSRLNDEFRERSLDLARLRGGLFPLMKVASGLGAVMVLTYGGMRVARGTLSLGDLVAFLGYLHILAWPTMAMGWMLSILQRGRAAMRRLEQVFAVEPEIADAPNAVELPVVRGQVEFRDVDFTYAGRADGGGLIRHVSFTVAAGEKLAIVGRTGAGKTTLVQLLPRLFDVTGGAILLDGHDVRTLSLRTLRRAIGFVPQDPFLFSTTIRENIAFGLDGPSGDLIHEAARSAGVSADIESFPAGYETVVGERGLTLSGGQKQRVTLARAIAVEPAILVLDDALSSVDTRTEREVLHHLSSVTAGRTCIVIAHRISTVRDADHIAVVDEGRVVEFGDHESLLARDGVYTDLFRRQQLEEEIAGL
jgi:ATP-binding cassette, subfamily B, multidrug efflux pump